MFRRGGQADAPDEPDLPSLRDEVLATLEPWVRAHRRPAWRPRVTAGEPTGGRSRSKFGGQPWLTADEAPPACARCGRPLRLLVQLDLAALPDELGGRHGEGVLQLFSCGADEASLVRVVPAAAVSPAAAGDVLPVATIVGWDRFDDEPDPEDHDLAGLSASYDFRLRTVTLRCPEVGLDATVGLDELGVEDIARASEHDKLGGWPFWPQTRDYPACPTCGQPMQLLLQLDSEDHIAFTTADPAIGHITQCPAHPTTPTFTSSTT